jgi:hypothetical protein
MKEKAFEDVKYELKLLEDNHQRYKIRVCQTGCHIVLYHINLLYTLWQISKSTLFTAALARC